MTAYMAEVDANGIVLRVIVCDDSAWPDSHLGGTWVETADPYRVAVQEVAYCGPGHGYDDVWPEKFAPPWEPWDGTFDEANHTPYQVGSKAFHDGHIWESTTPDNVWEPGVSGWHDSPVVGYPEWVQPTGAHDAYAVGAIVTHNGQNWESTTPDNVWEPGVFGWTVFTG